MSEFCMVFVTLPDNDVGSEIAEKLVSESLCACASISHGHTSFFIWKGNQEKAAETLMIIKTRVDLLGKLEKRIRELHPYEVFEFLALPVLSGNRQYLDWINESVGK